MHAAEFDADFISPAVPNGFSSGHLVVRPESLRFLKVRSEAQNCLEGRLCNEYVLGPRVQYQVRVGEHVFIVEKLRQQAFSGQRDDQVLIGWDATSLAASVNRRYAPFDTVLHDGDEVVFIPPVSGG